jgi:voltage-gated potassium channel
VTRQGRLPLSAAAGKVHATPRPNLIERRMTRFLREPPSVRSAASVIVAATAAVVVGAGVLMRVFDHSEYSNVWVGMWWALQTATSVGYGDVTPKNATGRIIAAFVMLEGIAFLAIITAAITSSFINRAQAEKERTEIEDEATGMAHLDARFDELAERLDRLESALGDSGPR